MKLGSSAIPRKFNLWQVENADLKQSIGFLFDGGYDIGKTGGEFGLTKRPRFRSMKLSKAPCNLLQGALF